MPTIVPIVLGLCIIGLLFCFFMLYRNQQVYNEKMRALAKASLLSRHKIDHKEPDYLSPYEILGSVSYKTMLNHFWRPVKSFYAGTILEE